MINVLKHTTNNNTQFPYQLTGLEIHADGGLNQVSLNTYLDQDSVSSIQMPHQW